MPSCNRQVTSTSVHTAKPDSASAPAVTHRNNRTHCLWLEQFQIAEYALPVDDKLPGSGVGQNCQFWGAYFCSPLLNADAPACCWARCGWFHPGRPYRKRERPTPVPVPAMCGETLDEGALIQRARQGWRPGEGRGNGRRRPPARMPAPVGYPAATQRVCRLGSRHARASAAGGVWLVAFSWGCPGRAGTGRGRSLSATGP